MSVVTKRIPKSILIFGAAGRVGRPLTQFLTREAPDIRLSLVARGTQSRQELQQLFPKARVIAADYEDPSSLLAAVKDIEGVFVISGPGMIEEATMPNLVAALKEENKVIQVIRMLGVFPELPQNRIPSHLSAGALPVQHPIAKRIFDESGLPVTYINCGASFIDNLWLQIRSVWAEKTLIWPEHRVPFIDPRDVGEVAGRLFLSDNGKHIGAFHTMNNGQDLLRFREVAEILSEVLEQPIAYEGSNESFQRFYSPRIGPRAKRLWDFFKFEEANEETWALNDFVERTIGRNPITVRGWIEEHKNKLVRSEENIV